MISTRRSFAALGVGCAFGFAPQRAFSQIPAGKDPATFSSDVRVVNVLATVRTSTGALVSNLTKDDFVLLEDDRPQSIQYFSHDTNLPLILGLLVDTSDSQIKILGREEKASYQFLDQVLREDVDKAFLIRFMAVTDLLQDVTPSREKLKLALGNLDAPVPIPGLPSRGTPKNWRVGGGATKLYDAVYLAADEIMRQQRGRKAVVVLTDGVDHRSRVSMDMSIEHAQRADTLVYSIMFKGDEGYDSKDSLKAGYAVLQKMSRETGGGFFEVSRKMSIEAIYKRIEEELRSQYSIGYTPDRAPAGGGYRRISLTTRQKNLVVQARQGYYPAAG